MLSERLEKTLVRTAQETGDSQVRLRRRGSFLAPCGALERARRGRVAGLPSLAKPEILGITPARGLHRADHSAQNVRAGAGLASSGRTSVVRDIPVIAFRERIDYSQTGVAGRRVLSPEWRPEGEAPVQEPRFPLATADAVERPFVRVIDRLAAPAGGHA